MNKQVKKHIDAAYNILRSMTVSHDNVKKVALAEQELEYALRAAEIAEKAVKAIAESKAQPDEKSTDEVKQDG